MADQFAVTDKSVATPSVSPMRPSASASNEQFQTQLKKSKKRDNVPLRKSLLTKQMALSGADSAAETQEKAISFTSVSSLSELKTAFQNIKTLSREEQIEPLFHLANMMVMRPGIDGKASDFAHAVATQALDITRDAPLTTESMGLVNRALLLVNRKSGSIDDLIETAQHFEPEKMEGGQTLLSSLAMNSSILTPIVEKPERRKRFDKLLNIAKANTERGAALAAVLSNRLQFAPASAPTKLRMTKDILDIVFRPTDASEQETQNLRKEIMPVLYMSVSAVLQSLKLDPGERNALLKPIHDSMNVTSSDEGRISADAIRQNEPA